MTNEQSSTGNMRAVIQFLNGCYQIDAVKLKLNSGTIFGREKGDIVLNDHEISASHCQIQRSKGVYQIYDMNSSNGTFVNGKKVLKHELKDGDKIEIGKTCMIFKLLNEAETTHISPASNTGNEWGDAIEKTSIVEDMLENEQKNKKQWQIGLHVTYPDNKTEEIVLLQNIVSIGRATSFGRFDEDTDISRRHLLIRLNESGEVFIEDEGSTNGSFLNEQRVAGLHIVKATDTVRLGSCVLRIKSIPG